MADRLPQRLIKMRVAQILAILVLVFGPIGSLGALQSLTSDCLAGCPCDAEEQADPCDDEHADEDSEHHDETQPASDDCADDCDDCDCERGISSAVATQAVSSNTGSIPNARPDPMSGAPPQAGTTDIFIPPRH